MANNKTHFRWVVVGLLFLINGVNYLDRSSIAYAIGKMTTEFGFNDDQIGMILGAFGIGYVITTLIGGIMADKFGAKRVLTLSIVLWGITSLLTSFANGFFVVFIARVLLGLAEGPGFPVMTRAISDWLPENERNRALCLGLVAVPLSLAIGGPVLSQLITWFTWRGAYVCLAILAILWVPLWQYLFKDSPNDAKQVNEQELAYIQSQAMIKSQLAGKKHPWKFMLLNKTLLVNNWAFFVFGYYLFFFMTWLPSYLKSTYQLDLTQVGYYSMAPWLMAALMMWTVAKLADYLFKKYSSLRLSRTYPICISQLLSASCIIPVMLFHNIYVAMGFISLAVGLIMSANTAYFAVVIDVAKERSGSAMGVMDAIFALSGIVAPSITGLVLTITGHYEAAFILMAILGVSSALLVWLFHNKPQ
jgi:MFS transporter, ACS family, aldohexuronate transporter